MNIFQKVQNGQYTVIVTHHVLNEIFDVLKKQAVVATKHEVWAERQTKQLYSQFTTTLLSSTNVLIKDPNISAKNLYSPAFSLLYKYSKGIEFAFSCPVCHSTFNFVDSDTIFRDDAVHAILAWALNCDEFITFDADFYQLSNEPLIQPLKISVIP